MLVCRAVASLLGRSPPPQSWPFPADPRGIPGSTVPRTLASTGSSSPGLASSSEIQPLSPAYRAHAVGASLGVPPLHRDISAEESTWRQGSRPHLCSAPSVSHALDGFLLSTPCRLVSSGCHVRGSLFRGFSRWPARWARRPPVPSCRLAAFACRRVAPPAPAPTTSTSGL